MHITWAKKPLCFDEPLKKLFITLGLCYNALTQFFLNFSWKIFCVNFRVIPLLRKAPVKFYKTDLWLEFNWLNILCLCLMYDYELREESRLTFLILLRQSRRFHFLNKINQISGPLSLCLLGIFSMEIIFQKVLIISVSMFFVCM